MKSLEDMYSFPQGTCKFQVEKSAFPGDFFAERTPEPTQYLNLMKSIWIVQQIKKGEEYKEASSDHLWDCYVKELDEVGASQISSNRSENALTFDIQKRNANVNSADSQKGCRHARG